MASLTTQFQTLRLTMIPLLWLYETLFVLKKMSLFYRESPYVFVHLDEMLLIECVLEVILQSISNKMTMVYAKILAGHELNLPSQLCSEWLSLL